MEGVVVLAYCSWLRKPLLPILSTSLVANIFTQTLLFVILNIFVQRYVVALTLSEILIWALEAFCLWSIRANQLGPREGLLLSLLMNIPSFGLGLFLPV